MRLALNLYLLLFHLDLILNSYSLEWVVLVHQMHFSLSPSPSLSSLLCLNAFVLTY